MSWYSRSLKPHSSPTELPPVLDLEWDCNEKFPLPFPEVMVLDDVVRPIKLHKTNLVPTGCDYRLRAFPDIGGVERKRPEELAQNLLTRDFYRQTCSLLKLARSFRHRLLLIEGTPLDLARINFDNIRGTPTTPLTYYNLMNRLMYCTQNLGLQLMFAGHSTGLEARRAVGQSVLYWLAGVALAGDHHGQEKKPRVTGSSTSTGAAPATSAPVTSAPVA